MIVGFGDATDDYLEGDRSDDGQSSSDTGATAVGIANSSGLTALVTGITSMFGGHSTTGKSSGTAPKPPASSGTSPLVWVAGAGALLLVGLVLLNRRAAS